MPGGPSIILGGLPVWAEVWFTRGDGWMTDDDAGVTSLHWLKSDGTKGKEVSKKIYDRLDKIDYWEVDVVDRVSDYLAYKDYEDGPECQLETGPNSRPEFWDRPRTVAELERSGDG